MPDPSPQTWKITAVTPPAEDYLRLRVVAGMSPKTAAGAAAGLPNTFYALTATCTTTNAVVGMGRIIGDGGLFFQIVDIAVQPEWQKQGIGKAIVDGLVEHVKGVAPEGAYVSLIADGEAGKLYEKYGFKFTAPKSVGMAFVVGK